MKLYPLIKVILLQDLQLTYRNKVDSIKPLLFFVMVFFIYSLAFTNDSISSHTLIFILWLTVLLSTILSIDKLYDDDYRNGFIDLYLLSNYPLTIIILTKLVAHWLGKIMPVILAASLVTAVMDIHFNCWIITILTLILSTFTILNIASMILAFTVHIKNASLLLFLVLLPLVIPVVLLSLSAIMASEARFSVIGYLSFLSALFIICITFCPSVTAFGLKNG